MSLLAKMLGALTFSAFLCVECQNRTVVHWEVITLVQHWLPTNCRALLALGKTRSCRMPRPADSWTVHGVWPTNFEVCSPFFCHHAATFRLQDLAPLQRDLDETWPHILDATEPTIWAKEWRKHGTCLDLPEWNSPTKYFQLGVQMQRKYDLKTILYKAQIYPSNNNNYTLEQFKRAIHKNLGKNPSVTCFVHDNIQYVKEIYICFTKELNLIDCDFRYGSYCDPNMGIIYSSFR